LALKKLTPPRFPLETLILETHILETHILETLILETLIKAKKQKKQNKAKLKRQLQNFCFQLPTYHGSVLEALRRTKLRSLLQNANEVCNRT
jgi:acetyl-CoA carboxylase alpha subunit